MEIYSDIVNGANDTQLRAKLEKEIQGLASSNDGATEARKTLREWLRVRLGDSSKDSSIADLLSTLSRTEKNKSTIATLLRCMAIPGLLPEANGKNNIELSIVTLCERAMPELVGFLRIDTKSQTYIKYQALTEAHNKIEEIMSPLKATFSDLDAAMGAKKSILGALSHSIVRSYCAGCNIQQIKSVVEDIYYKLKVVESVQPTLLIDIEDCNKALNDGFEIATENGSFLALGFLNLFLENTKKALDNFFQSSKARFSTKIIPGFNSELKKRYPIHEIGREIQVSIPFKNVGPGLATNIKAIAVVEDEAWCLDNPTILLGNVMPGDFSIILDVLIIAPSVKCEIAIEFYWGEIGSNETQSELFTVTVFAQSCDIDWGDLEYVSPYSTEPAEGKDFVGRLDKVKFLAGKLLRQPMESFYVTGQKRVGKTSLVLAALEFAAANIQSYTLFHKVILWGSIAYEDPRESVSALGRSIEELIKSSSIDFRSIETASNPGSLAALIQLCDSASRIAPHTRFIIVIDEFDEIHQELYLYGNLAETFFANLRALSRCKNICLVLIGGENMPYVMERQGQKLNNFSRINLSYYSRDMDWLDFKLLVQSPTDGIIDWHDDAITAIYNISNGNPYFAKIICAAAFNSAIQQRDADVTSYELKQTMEEMVSSLGSNSFAHLWQDGIPKPTTEREPDILIRIRALVAIARCSRKNLEITLDNIIKYQGSIPIAEHEINAVLNDFTRREVLAEINQSYKFILPIFREWLVDVGVSQLAADSLGAELADATLKEEKEALVKSEEVIALARSWPTFRGRHISSDEIRAWFEQVANPKDQRLLFEILRRVKFFSESKVRECLKHSHGFLLPILPEFVIRKRSDRRNDIIVTYVDGEGKSGAQLAMLYAEENQINANCIFPPGDFKRRMESHISNQGNAAVLVVVDDIAATGKSLRDNVDDFISNHSELLEKLGTKVRVISIITTVAAQTLILNSFQKIEKIDIDFRACEILQEEDKAFPGNGAGWKTMDDFDRAKALCIDYGSKIYNRQSPLGHGNLGLLVVFPTNTPNNSLPILHSMARSGSGISWNPIFPRIIH